MTEKWTNISFETDRTLVNSSTIGGRYIDARRITIFCALPLLLFLVEYLALAGLNLLAQLLDRVMEYFILEMDQRQIQKNSEDFRPNFGR